MKKLTGVLVTPDSAKKFTMDYENYKSFYPVLNCDIFEIAPRRIGTKKYDIYCDDEGSFVKDNHPTYVTLDKQDDIAEVIVGNIFILNSDEDGETISLTDDECEDILSHVGLISFGEKQYEVICGGR